MRYTGLLIGSVLCAFIFARPAFAQNGVYAPQPGDFRVGASFSSQGVAYVDLDDRKQTLAGFSIDYFATPNFSLNLGFGYSEDEIRLRASDFFDSPDDILVSAKSRSTAFSVGVGYYFSNPDTTTNVLPFVRASYIAYDVKLSLRVTGEDGELLDSGSIGVKPSGLLLEGGAHFFLNDNASVDLTIAYVNVRGGGRKFDGFSVGVGLSLWFR